MSEWVAVYGKGKHCSDGNPHLAPSVPDTVDEVLCELCGCLLERHVPADLAAAEDRVYYELHRPGGLIDQELKDRVKGRKP